MNNVWIVGDLTRVVPDLCVVCAVQPLTTLIDLKFEFVKPYGELRPDFCLPTVRICSLLKILACQKWCVNNTYVYTVGKYMKFDSCEGLCRVTPCTETLVLIL